MMTASINDINYLLPNEILGETFLHLNANDMLAFGGVCKRWNVITNDNSFLWDKLDLRALFPTLTFTMIDKAAWKKVVHDVGLGLWIEDEPSIKMRMAVIALNKLCSSNKDVKGVTILTMPKFLHPQIWCAFTNADQRFLFKSKNALPVIEANDWAKNAIQDEIIEETHRIIIPNTVLAKSRNKTVDEEDAFIKQLTGFEKSNALQLITNVMMHKLLFNTKLLEDSSLISCVRCIEKTNRGSYTTISGFDISGDRFTVQDTFRNSAEAFIGIIPVCKV